MACIVNVQTLHMLFASIFGPAFTGLGVVLACAVVVLTVLCPGEERGGPHHSDFTVRWRRRK